MRKFLLGMLVGVILVILSILLFAKRLQIETRIWHWSHGGTTFVGDFKVPVPRPWCPFRDPDGFVTLVDSRSALNTVTITLASHPFPDTDSWRSLQRGWLEDHGYKVIEERTLRAGNLTIACLGGNEDQKLLKLPSNYLSIECISTGPLGIYFNGDVSTLPEFYAIVSQIQKRS